MKRQILKHSELDELPSVRGILNLGFLDRTQPSEREADGYRMEETGLIVFVIDFLYSP